jgi:GTP diphosphokinase / guanosine-3',5'-bis(diphosphate) 3'-diphosphatase
MALQHKHMLRQYELVERVRGYDPEANEALLNRAYVFSMKAHGSQLRASGDPYFSHPIEVAGILTDLKLDTDTIVTAILHDTIEDTVATYQDIETLFGANIARLVDGVTKLSKIEAQTETERAAENFRKFLLAMSDDIRVLLVKLADRLHNMRTLHHIKKPEKRRRIARETMDIYAPLAERIGMYEIKDELQEIAFGELEPEAYETVTSRLSQLRTMAGDMVPRVITQITNTLEEANIPAFVSGREKRPYSIWKKMQERHITFEKLSDVMAFRVVVPELGHVYSALGLIHRRWPCVPGRFKDYISTPKRNGYRSLHTTVMGRDPLRIEIQIRTQAMHEEAEFGVAAHWAYKQKELSQKEFGKKRLEKTSAPSTKTKLASEPSTQYPWLQDLLDILANAGSDEELMEHTKLAMYQDQVFCFTPKGELIRLPKGSTPVDFAYALHTNIGDTTVGAKVNGRTVPLRTLLHNGDQVEILRSKNQTPQKEWEAFVITGKARSTIRRHIKEQERADYKILGKQILDNLLSRAETPIAENAIDQALGRLKLPDRDALYVALGRHDLTDDAVMAAIIPGSTPEAARKARINAEPNAPGVKPVTLKGLTPGIAVHLAQCCHPIPGDRIVAIRTTGRGVDVHTIDCKSLESLVHVLDRWIDVAWLPAGEERSSYTVTLQLIALHQPGALATITSIIARNMANISNIKLTHRDPHFHTFILDLEVADLAHLTNIIAALRAAKVVSSAERLRG